MSAPTFGRIPEALMAIQRTRPNYPTRFSLRSLDSYISLSSLQSEHKYGRGSWGYTVLRTVYTPGSDEMFAMAIERLKIWTKYDLHKARFIGIDTQLDEDPATEIALTEELWSRFFIDIVEDKENLDLQGPLKDRRESIKQLEEYFHTWVKNRLEPREPFDNVRKYGNTRFSCPLIIDSEALSSLYQLPEETPPLRRPVDMEERRSFLLREGSAWVWLIDTLRLQEDGEPWDGLLKMKSWSMRHLFFDRMAVREKDLWREKSMEDGETEDWWYEGCI
jgi:hypothetical protein